MLINSYYRYFMHYSYDHVIIIMLYSIRVVMASPSLLLLLFPLLLKGPMDEKSHEHVPLKTK